MYYIQLCNNTQDLSQQNMFVFIIFSWIVRHETLYSPFKIIFLISRPDNMPYWQNWEPSTPKNFKLGRSSLECEIGTAVEAFREKNNNVKPAYHKIYQGRYYLLIFSFSKYLFSAAILSM